VFAFVSELFYQPAERIFHINLENDQEEHVRDQLNKGVVPEDISVHCYIGFLFDFPSHCVCENVYVLGVQENKGGLIWLVWSGL